MPDSDQLETFAAGIETAVDVAGIERQLRDLWQAAAVAEQDPSRRAISRACLLNFVAYAEAEAARDHAAATVAELTSRYPCRAIVLLAQPQSVSPELSASITAHCHLAGAGARQVCCEQISIRALGGSVRHLAGAVLPLLESDLPTVLWWQGNFLEQPDLFHRLSAVVDRVIFDTSGWVAPETHLAALASLIQQQRRNRFTDLSWTRLTLWRELVAEFFDDPPCRAELDGISAVEIVHGCGPGARLRALLLGGWLAAQLQWPPERAESVLRLQSRDDPDTTPVGIREIALTTAHATFRVRKNHGEHTASATVTMPNACGLPYKRAFEPSDDTSLLAQELDSSVRSTLYDRALAQAAALV